MPASQGIYVLGATGVAVGGLAAGAPPGVWAHADAVLNVGVVEHGGMQGPEAGEGPEEHSGLDAEQGGAHEAHEAPAACTTTSGPHDPHACYARGPPCAPGAQPPHPSTSGRAPSAAPRPPGRYLWLPVPSSKLARAGLADVLDAALGFLAWHVGRGRRVLIHDHQGARGRGGRIYTDLGGHD